MTQLFETDLFKYEIKEMGPKNIISDNNSNNNNIDNNNFIDYVKDNIILIASILIPMVLIFLFFIVRSFMRNRNTNENKDEVKGKRDDNIDNYFKMETY
jgi:ATP-dependent Zn protease